MDAKLKAKAMTDDQLDGVAGGRLVMGEGVRKQDNDGRYWQLSTWKEVENEGVYHKGTIKEQPTLNTYSLKFL